MNLERDRFLTKIMGLCWHEWADSNMFFPSFVCEKCNTSPVENIDFSTWEGFGKLWEWAMKQEYLNSFMGYATNNDMIHPGCFADAIYEYLKGELNVS